MAKKKPTRASRWASDAALQALVRYGPETSGLTELARQAQQDRDTTIRQAHGSAASMMGSIDTARPEVAQIYDQAGLDQARTASLLSSQTAGLSGVADPIRAATANEEAQGSRHLTEMRASNLADLSNRRVQARSGEQFAVQGAQQRYVQDIAKVLQRRQDLAGEKGAFEASTVNSLEQAYLGRALSSRNSQRSASQSERNSVRSSGIDPDTGKPIPGGKLDPKAKPHTATGQTPVSRDKHLEYQNSIKSIASYAQKYKGHLSRHEIVQKLTQGRPQSSGYADPKTGAPVAKGTPGAVPYTLAKIPQFAPDLKMTAALDVALDGHLSRATQRALSKAGFVIGDLDLPTFGHYKRAGGSMQSYDQRRQAANYKRAVRAASQTGGNFS